MDLIIIALVLAVLGLLLNIALLKKNQKMCNEVRKIICIRKNGDGYQLGVSSEIVKLDHKDLKILHDWLGDNQQVWEEIDTDIEKDNTDIDK